MPYPDNAISWMKLGNELHMEDIKAQCQQIMVHNFTEITKQLDFLAMNIAEVQDYRGLWSSG